MIIQYVVFLKLPYQIYRLMRSLEATSVGIFQITQDADISFKFWGHWEGYLLGHLFICLFCITFSTRPLGNSYVRLVRLNITLV
jgi:hypothetical protein